MDPKSFWYVSLEAKDKESVTLMLSATMWLIFSAGFFFGAVGAFWFCN